MASDNNKVPKGGVWGFIKGVYGKAKKASDDNHYRHLQDRTEKALVAGDTYRDEEEVALALGNIPDNWKSFDLDAIKALTSGPISELETATANAEAARIKAKQEAAEQEKLDTRYFEVMSLLNDDAALAIFTAGEVMSEHDHRNFKGVLKAHTPKGDGMRDSYVRAGMQVMADNRYPDSIDYACIVGQIDESDRQLLRVAASLFRHNIIQVEWFEKAFAGAIFTSGQHRVHQNRAVKETSDGIFQNMSSYKDVTAIDTLTSSLGVYLHDSNVLKQEIISLTTDLQNNHPTSPVVQELTNAAGGGANWFNSADALSSIYDLEPGKGLFLGQLEDGGFLNYDGEGSLFTIAPPGSGKTQCQVLPNLVMYDGPSIVLDVKGECFEQTAGVRSMEFGPVMRFSPSDWDNSAHYNPLDFVREDARYLASDARKLADMLIVPQATSDPYWEQRGRDVLAALIGFVVAKFDADERNMKSVMDCLSPSADTLVKIIETMRETGISFLERSANQIEGMSEKQLSSIFDSARSQLSVWDLGELDPITDRSDWHPRDFKRQGKPLTLYLCVGPAEIDRFASVLRVIIGQHLDYFMEVLPDNVDKPIVFFLDEAPQLGNFEPLPKASSMGRQYGLRLWLFAQNRNQVETAYRSAETILGNAVVQCWMNPDETAAQHLERNLGRTRSLFDGQERPLVQSHELRGPDFKDTIIVVGRGEKPAQLAKHFAYQDSSLKNKMGLPIAQTEPA